ncbi:MAG: Smr/MutS family protein [Gammaproteobacteria bacterium]|nr:Smr/MutS family protein [Gammaproteobacteria bacterium]
MSGNGKRFADLVGKVRRLEHDTVEHARPRPPARRRRPPDHEPGDAGWSELPEDAATTTADEYQRPGIQHSMLRKLRRSQFPVEESLDLHGLRLEEARRELSRFLATAGGARLRCVRIVHGKGMSSPGLAPVLKPNVRHWLREDAGTGVGGGTRQRRRQRRVDVLLRARQR